MTAEGDVETETHKKRKSLLEKYEIPLDHLDFKYIKECNNVLEIEKIVKILRCKNEGYFPDLLKCAEEKLKSLNCNHRLLRTDTPIMTKDAFTTDEWKSIVTDDIEEWKDEISTKDKVLNKTPKTNANILPEVRKSTIGIPKEPKDNNSKKTDRIPSTDYKSWDKYDAEKECMMISLEDEQKEEEKRKKEKEVEVNKNKTVEEEALESVLGCVEHLANEEREQLAFKEKEIGNEFYKTNHLNDAIRHYTRSIHINPTCTGYNNRAATYLKQCKFNKALVDLNVALQFNPKDVKALYRRAITLQHKNQFPQALEDVREVLRMKPNHVTARHLADQLRENCASMPKKHKLMIRDKNHPGDNRVSEVTEEEMLRDYKDVNFIEVNDWGLPKIMCNCDGKYINEPGIRHEEHVRFQHMRNQNSRSNTTISHISEVKKSQENAQAKKRNLEPEAPIVKKLEIVELEKIVEEEKSEDNPKKVGAESDKERAPSKKISAESDKERAPRSCTVFDKRLIKNHLTSNHLPAKINNEEEISNIPDNDKTNVKNNKTVKNINIQDFEESKGLKEINAEFNKCIGLVDCGCGDRPTNMSYQFLRLLSENNHEELQKHQGNILRSICPQHLSTVVGTVLNENVLLNLFKSLYHQFDHKTDEALIRKYCEAIVKLERYSIIEQFLSEEDKKIINELEKVVGPFVEKKRNS